MKKNRVFSLVTLGLVAGLIPACSGSSGIVNPLYTVTFNYCDSKNPSEMKITRTSGAKGTNVALPTVNASGSKKFLGWSKKYNSSKKYGDADSVLSGSTYTIGESNIVLYASYEVQNIPVHTEEEVNAYMDGLKSSSVDGHLYYHYYRFDQDYSDWDVWSWPYKPATREGVKFDFVGQDDFGGSYIDMDLTKEEYDGGWDANAKTFGGKPTTFIGADQIGLQIVKASTRITGSGFWVNDGSNLFVALEDYAMPLTGGGTAYHIFVVQDNVQSPSARPSTSNEDPFEEDDGTNVTYGDPQYNNVDWSQKTALTPTASDFKDLGVGYQIMVSSFADTDSDGTGDIYGITCKIPYLKKLGVRALWLTPVQLSDSYHGYDIIDYETIDPKFGSKNSPAGIANGGHVTSATALEDYKELINTAHANNMKVVMDLVLNHTSTANKWFVKSANLNPEYRGYYQWGNHVTNPGNINEAKAWYQYGDHDYSFYAKFGSGMPELNYSYKSTREAVEDMSVYWTKTVGVDGFRLDAVKHIYMSDETTDSTVHDTLIKDIEKNDYSSNLSKNLHFFRELKKVVSEESGKEVFFVGENFDGHAYHVAPYYEAFDSMFDFYAYYNLTSAAATGRKNTTSAYGTADGFMTSTSTYNYDKETQDNKKGIYDGEGIMAQMKGKQWNFPSVYQTYNEYRHDNSLPGLFTSNHDIARVINRIAGTGTGDGIQAQGSASLVAKINNQDNPDYYPTLEKSANCVKIAELMFPGLTWVYYGDEIGMTGNFPEGKDADSPYADLSYRQPMKWASDINDDLNVNYFVTGATDVGWDEVNASDLVVPAMTQMDQPNSEYNMLAKFINLKSNADGQHADVSQALILGSIENAYHVGHDLAANTLGFTRKLGNTTIKVLINFNNTTVTSYGMEGTVLATYNDATQTSMPPFSAIVVKA